jgi:selenocysteine lyase/cysteine desulfurase
MEHNAVLRPVQSLSDEGRITYDVFSTVADAKQRSPLQICARIAEKCRSNTRAIICSHQSNLCSAALELKEIGALCRRHNLLFIVDAAQSAGHLPISIREMNIDVLCAPGHKGLLGMQGCGFAILGERVNPKPLIEGGSGYQSLSPHMPNDFPERGEAGTLCTPAIASLRAGLDFIEHIGIQAIHAYECRLFELLSARLQSLPEYSVYLPEMQGSTLLFNRNGVPADRIGQALGEHGICVRSGYHCAALGHQTLRTPEGGAVRVSFGPFNTEHDVDMLYAQLRHMEFLHEVE